MTEAPFTPIDASQTAMAIMTAIRTDDLDVVRGILADLGAFELRLVIFGVLGATKHFLAYIAEDIGDDFERLWQQAAVEIASTP